MIAAPHADQPARTGGHTVPGWGAAWLISPALYLPPRAAGAGTTDRPRAGRDATSPRRLGAVAPSASCGITFGRDSLAGTLGSSSGVPPRSSR